MMLGWFGVRGIGSIYYLAYALNHGLKTNAEDLISLVISIIALSILIHGLIGAADFEKIRIPYQRIKYIERNYEKNRTEKRTGISLGLSASAES